MRLFCITSMCFIRLTFAKYLFFFSSESCMKRLVVVESQRHLREEIGNMLSNFDSTGTLAVDGERNTIRTVELGGEKWSVKRFKKPNLFNSLVYRWIRPTKARRSFDYAERLAESAYENASSLTPAAEALGLTVKESDWITRDGFGSGVLNSPRVTNAAYSDDVLIEGNNSDLIEIGAQQAVVVRVVEHQLAGVKPFEENRDEIRADFIAVRAAEAAEAAGKAAVERVKAQAAGLVDIAGPYDGAVEGPETISRNSGSLPVAVTSAAFAIAPTAGGEGLVTGASSANGDYFVIAVDAVTPGEIDQLDDQTRSALLQQLSQQQAEATLRDLIDELRLRTKVELLPIGD